jgi:dienelactone hydrolase
MCRTNEYWKIVVRCAFAVAAFCAATVPAGALARQVEEVVQIPVEVRDIYRRTHQHTITVTIFRDDERQKSPFLILNHGRAGNEGERARLGRARYTNHSKYFVTKGFAVFVPTRIGYGVTGGPDVENSGRCAQRDFAPVFEAGASQTLKAIEYAKAQPYVDSSRGLLVGQSFGGAITIAVAAKNVEGVVAAINFAGGSGGDPEKSPEKPCSEPALRRVLSDYGATSKQPTLWLYSENDQYWGKDKPRAWFEAFRAKGGSGEFVQMPPFRNDGHATFVGNPAAWKPAVEKLLSSHGFGP